MIWVYKQMVFWWTLGQMSIICVSRACNKRNLISPDHRSYFFGGNFLCKFAAHQEMDVACAEEWHCCHQSLAYWSSREREAAGPHEERNKDSCSLNSSSTNNL